MPCVNLAVSDNGDNDKNSPVDNCYKSRFQRFFSLHIATAIPSYSSYLN